MKKNHIKNKLRIEFKKNIKNANIYK